jgi:hypothetical protein
MDEQAAFETRSVLPPRHSALSRLALLLPALALVATAWLGLSGRSGQDAGASPNAAAVAEPSQAAERSPGVTEQPGAAQPPARALGLEVHALDELDPGELDRNEVLAISGWYLATEITNCPPLADLLRETAGPAADGYVDSWRFCERSGVLFATQPMFKGGQPANAFEENRSKNSGLPAIDVTVDEHVVMPAQLELIGGDATPVVVFGRFVEPDDRCHWPMDCPYQLVVDQVAWTPGPLNSG